MATFRLVEFVPAHLPELTDLWAAAWAKAMPTIDFDARRAWLVERVDQLRAQGCEVICALDAATGKMAGFITIDPSSGHIDQLASAPRYWSRGAAAELLEETKRRATRALTLEVNQDNARALRFYEKHGFRRRAAGVNPNSGLKTWHYVWTPARRCALP